MTPTPRSTRRVLFVSHYYPPHLGGIEQVVRNEARRLAELGLGVEVLTTDGDHPAGRTSEDGVQVRRVRAWHGLSRRGVPFPVISPGAAWAMVRAVRRADVVHVHDTLYLTSWLAALVARLLRTPYVVTQHVGVVDHPRRVVMVVQQGVRATAVRFVLRAASRVVVINDFVGAATRDLVPALVPTVLHNGVDTEVYEPLSEPERARLRERLGLPPDKQVVLYVGRFVSKKGFEHVLGSVSDDHLTVFVGGTRPSTLPHDGRALFVGDLSSDEVVPWYQAADLFVGASVGESPLTVLEALSCGLPALLHDDPGVRALGVLPGDARLLDLRSGGLADAIRELLSEPDTLADLRAAGRSAARRALSWSAHVGSLQELYAQVVTVPRGPSAAGGRPRRVAVVTPYFPPDTGGVERYAARLVQGLQDSPHHEPVVITSHARRRTRTVVEDGVLVVRLPRGPVVSNTPVNPWWCWQIRRWLTRLDVDVVSAHAPVPFMADVTLFLGGRPAMLTYHAGSLVKGGSQVDSVLRAYERLVLPRLFARASSLVAVSEASMSRRFGATLIPGGVDTDLFHPPSDDTERRPSQLLYVGRIQRSSSWKGLHVAIDALAILAGDAPDVRLRVVGEGDAVADLQQRARDQGVHDRVDWVGPLTGPALAAAYRAAAAVVIPSLSEAENSPLVALEAMASATPVIGSRVGGIPYLVRHGVDGLLVPPGSAEALARAVVSLVGDPDLAARLGGSARLRAETDFPWSRQLDLMLRELDRISG